jgi:hypothetical protein
MVFLLLWNTYKNWNFYEFKHITQKYFVAKVKEKTMAKKNLLLGILVMALVFGLALSSCATYATRGGVPTPIGYFTPTIQADGGRKVIGSYAVIFGLFTIGYSGFVSATQGKEIDIVDTNFLWIYRGIRAVER